MTTIFVVGDYDLINDKFRDSLKSRLDVPVVSIRRDDFMKQQQQQSPQFGLNSFFFFVIPKQERVIVFDRKDAGNSFYTAIEAASKFAAKKTESVDPTAFNLEKIFIVLWRYPESEHDLYHPVLNPLFTSQPELTRFKKAEHFFSVLKDLTPPQWRKLSAEFKLTSIEDEGKKQVIENTPTVPDKDKHRKLSLLRALNETKTALQLIK
eukprot:m.114589 g.114589  ORF g.114589 m.114589 type:complete len:208 (+) comp37509_c0_seq1:278-901(+)